MPTFCRHNRLIQNCPICSREQSIELRPIVTSGTPKVSEPRSTAARAAGPALARARSASGMRVSRLERGAEDGYHSRLVPGLKSSVEAERLAAELAFAVTRLKRLSDAPPGLYAEVAADGDVEERTWLAFLVAYVCPLDGDDPFAEVRRVRTTWSSGADPDLAGVEVGPRSAYDPTRGTNTIDAYRAWAARSGSQAAAFTGEDAWPPERRFARVFERLALPGLHRDARYDLLVTLGQLGVYELAPGSLQFGGDNAVTVAAKRALGIGDPMLLERRAAELAAASGLPLAALDLGLHNWERGERATVGLGLDDEPDPDALAATLAALGL
jgi:hypothetical protein